MSHSVILKENVKMLSVVIQKNGTTLSVVIDKDQPFYLTHNYL